VQAAWGRHGRIVSAVKCEACGDELPALARQNRRYCDSRCRRRAYEERHARLAPVVPVAEITEDEHTQEVLARVLAEPRLVAHVAAAARTQWRAAAFLLERHYADRWAPVRRSAVEPELPVVAPEDDPFAEVDQLAAKRRARKHRE
jgi:hypothetical protein